MIWRARKSFRMNACRISCKRCSHWRCRARREIARSSGGEPIRTMSGVVKGRRGGWGLGCVANKGLINCGFASVASKGLTSRFCGSVANTGLSDITGGGGGLHGMSEKGHVAARAKQAEQKQPNPKYSRHYTEELRFVTPLIGCPSYAKYRS